MTSSDASNENLSLHCIAETRNMSAEYYGVGPEICAAVERLLNLRKLSPGEEQEWEFFLGDPARIDEIVDLLERRDLDLEMRSAVAQLLMSGIYNAESDGVLSFDSIERASFYLATDPEVYERMVFFWLSEGWGIHTPALAFALGHDPAPFEPFED